MTPEEKAPAGANPDTDPTPQEMEEILAELEFFLHMDEAEALPLEEEEEEEDGDAQ